MSTKDIVDLKDRFEKLSEEWLRYLRIMYEQNKKLADENKELKEKLKQLYEQIKRNQGRSRETGEALGDEGSG